MMAPLYEEVSQISLDLIKASEREDEAEMVKSYVVLKRLCDDAEGSAKDHPLQWEALGDFSDSFEGALDAYRRGLACAERLELPEYAASIHLALSELYIDNENTMLALQHIKAAQTFKHNNLELTDAIKNLNLELESRS